MKKPLYSHSQGNALQSFHILRDMRGGKAQMRPLAALLILAVTASAARNPPGQQAWMHTTPQSSHFS
jgi:hypothetical protein